MLEEAIILLLIHLSTMTHVNSHRIKKIEVEIERLS